MVQTLQDSGYGGTDKRPGGRSDDYDGGDKENSSPNRKVCIKALKIMTALTRPSQLYKLPGVLVFYQGDSDKLLHSKFQIFFIIQTATVCYP